MFIYSLRYTQRPWQDWKVDQQVHRDRNNDFFIESVINWLHASQNELKKRKKMCKKQKKKNEWMKCIAGRKIFVLILTSEMAVSLRDYNPPNPRASIANCYTYRTNRVWWSRLLCMHRWTHSGSTPKPLCHFSPRPGFDAGSWRHWCFGVRWCRRVASS